ncbi:hypothetical protein, partial [Nocardia farcinica]|uniref:hypothetical protein n=1 Tax=Nocardia farcinica TaxID=37329 RepID=UPI00245694F9
RTGMITNTMIGPTHHNTSHPVRNTSCDGSNALAGAINPRTHRWRLGSPRESVPLAVCHGDITENPSRSPTFVPDGLVRSEHHRSADECPCCVARARDACGKIQQ